MKVGGVKAGQSGKRWAGRGNLWGESKNLQKSRGGETPVTSENREKGGRRGENSDDVTESGGWLTWRGGESLQ